MLHQYDQCQHIRRALEDMGHETDSQDGLVLSFVENEMAQDSLEHGWLEPLEAALWSSKHLYYPKLKMECRTITNLGDIMAVPYKEFWLKPSTSHYLETKKLRGLVKDKISFMVNTNFLWKEIGIYVAQPVIGGMESVWLFTLWDRSGKPAHLWFSTTKTHKTSHPLGDLIRAECERIGRTLGIRRWMTFMEFLIDGDTVNFIDLNPRLPGDDDWHELVYRHLTGRSAGRDIAEFIVHDRLPPETDSHKRVDESEWDGTPLAENQRLWEYSDGYKNKPVLTFIK